MTIETNSFETIHLKHVDLRPKAYARGGLGLKHLLDLDILQKRHYLRKGD